MAARLACACISVVLLAGALAVLSCFSARYPFYFIWDMDHVTTLDVLLLNSFQRPDHINHTGLGMYLIMKLSTLIAVSAGALETSRLEDLKNALNPVLAVAELKTFLRLHTPVIIVAGSAISFFAVQRISRRPLWCISGLIVLLTLLTQQWVVYHATMVRTEVYAVFFWQLSILAMTLTLSYRSQAVQLVCAAISGTLLGVALITKFQLLPYLIAFYPIAKLAFGLHKDHFAPLRELHARVPGLVISVNLLALVVFSFLAIVAWNCQLPPNYFVISEMTTGRAIFGPNLALTAFVSAGVIICGLDLFYKHSAVIRRVMGGDDLLLFSCIQAGYATAVSAALIALPNLSEGFSYMVANFKVAYLRQFEVLGLTDIFVHNWKQFLTVYPYLLITTGSALVLAATVGFRAPNVTDRIICLRTTGWGMLAVTAFAFGIVFYRFNVRDILWHETLLTFIAALLPSIVAGRVELWGDKRGKIAGVIVAGPLLPLMASNISVYPTLAAKTDLNFNIYGWSPEQEFKPVYPAGNHGLYDTIVKERFPDQQVEPTSAAGLAFRHALEWKRIHRMAQFVIPYQHVPLARIGVLVQNGPFRKADERFVEVPARLQGAIWIDLKDLPLRAIGTINPDAVSHASEAFDKIGPPRGQGQVALIPRADLNVVLFTPRPNSSRACPLKISVLKAGAPDDFCGELVEKYTDVKVTGDLPTFVAIQPRYGL